MKTKWILIAALIISTAACNKSPDGKIAKVNAIERMFNSMTNASDIVANPANRYDSVGYWHNVILDGIQPCVSQYMNADSIGGCIIQFAEKNGSPIQRVLLDTVKIIAAVRDSNFKSAIGNMPYSPHAKSLMDSLWCIVKRNALNVNADYNSIREPILSFENLVIMDKDLTGKETQVLLVACSVARYSVFYWMQVNAGGRALRFKNIFKWFAAVTGDIGTALTTGDPDVIAGASENAYWSVVYGMP